MQHSMPIQHCLTKVVFSIFALWVANITIAEEKTSLQLTPQSIKADGTVQYDFDIVYVRAPRPDGKTQNNKYVSRVWGDVRDTRRCAAGSDLVILHPDGSEDVLVDAGANAVVDPYVSFDAKWVYYSLVQLDEKGNWTSADIYKVNVASGEQVRLTQQEFTPNTGVVRDDIRPGVFNMGPCPVPGGRVVFTSTRNGLISVHRQEPGFAMQLFAMDDDGKNVDYIGRFNHGSALHPTVLRDGRVMFSTHEAQGLRSFRFWALWTIHPDGSQWEPLVSFHPRGNSVFHFATQLSNGQIVFEEYYHTSNMGFGTFYRIDEKAPPGEPYFGPADTSDPRNRIFSPNSTGRLNAVPFMPRGMTYLTPFTHGQDKPAPNFDPKNKKSPRVGKVTHPSAAPGNHLLLVYAAGAVITKGSHPAIDSGNYLLTSGQPIDEPGKLRLIKNDPKYNEQWPRALVPYRDIYGMNEPATPTLVKNDGTASPHLKEGTPFGLIGSASLYKRETHPGGKVHDEQVAATFAGRDDPFDGLSPFLASIGRGQPWKLQGAEAGSYSNSDIHAVRILLLEPGTQPELTKPGAGFSNAGRERMRILGEIPVRKFDGDEQPVDPDGKPDTSFLAKVPGDAVWTFQTLDKRGMVLNMSQTWHQVRPGEVRVDCGGCHAHSQPKTPFELTAAGQPDFKPFDLTSLTPLLTSKAEDESKRKWDAADETGLRFHAGPLDVEFYRDVVPIFERSCVACHTKSWKQPAGDLVLDDHDMVTLPKNYHTLPGKASRVYARLAHDRDAEFGFKPPLGKHWETPQVSRYVRVFQSRRSLLIWKIFGQRLDGWRDEDFVTEESPRDYSTIPYKGKPPLGLSPGRESGLYNLAFHGSTMPPPAAVRGEYKAPDGGLINVEPLSDDDRLTLVRWIDLGCPVDMAFNPDKPSEVGNGWRLDEQRPTLSVTWPQPGRNDMLSRLLIGMHDYGTGLKMSSFEVTANFEIDGAPAGDNLADRFKQTSDGIWEYVIKSPITEMPDGEMTFSIRDGQGNATRIVRSFNVGVRK